MKSIVTLMKADRVCARAEHNPAKFATLTNVLGDYDLAKSAKSNLGKSEDEIIIPILKVAISRAKNTVLEYKKLQEYKRAEASEMDVILLEKYLPDQISEEDLLDILEQFSKEGKKLPDFMKFLKENYKDQYDGKLASSLAKQKLV